MRELASPAREERDCKRTDLHKKPTEIKWIPVNNQSSDVANNLQDAPADHACQEAPCVRADPLNGVEDHGECENSDEGAVGRNRGLISKNAGLERADVQRTIGGRAKGDGAVGKLGHSA